MTQTPPIIRDGVLIYRQGENLAWLESTFTFTFHDEHSSFTAHKERAGNRRGRPYWRAYHTQNGKLHRVYLDQSGRLTLHRLHAVVAQLAKARDAATLPADPGFIQGGKNLFPAKIESFLMHHPKVAEAQVVGVPDAFFGEELLAVIRLREGELLTEQELRTFCEGRISHQKIPRYFQFVESYPMTASGKVQKFVLPEQAIHALGLRDVC